ncbi:24996_t:CDS:1, partial [Gigaspora rosea]
FFHGYLQMALLSFYSHQIFLQNIFQLTTTIVALIILIWPL